MATLKEIREAFPQYANVPDDVLSNALYEKFGEGREKADFLLELQGRGPRIGAFEASKQRLYGSLETGTAKVLQELGAERTAEGLEKKAAARREDVGARYQPRISGYEDIESIADVPEYAGQLIAGSAPQTLLQGVGALGALALTRGRARLPGIGPISKGTTAALGGGAAGLPAYFGANIERQMEEGASLQETEAAPAALAAVGQSALDAASLRVLFKGIPGVTAAEKGNFIARGAVRGLESGATEALTETAQQALEIIQADPEKFFELGPETQKELINAAVGGGLMGFTLGSVAGAVTRAPRPMDQGTAAPEGEAEPAPEPEPKKPDLLQLPPPEAGGDGAEPTGGPEGPAPTPSPEPMAPQPRPAPEPTAGPEAPAPIAPEPVEPVEPGKPVEPAAPEPVEPATPPVPTKGPDLFTTPNPPSLPKPLQLGKPKYGNFELNFATDIERALFQISKANPTEKDLEYADWLKKNGLSDSEIKNYAAQLRKTIDAEWKTRVKGGEKQGVIAVPRFNLGIAPKPAPAPAPVAPAPTPVPPPVQPAPVAPAPTPAPAPAPTAPLGGVPFTKQVSQLSENMLTPNTVQLSTMAPGQSPSYITISPQHRADFEAALPGGLDLLRELHARLLPGVQMDLKIENDPDGGTYGWNRVEGPARFTMALNPAAVAKATKNASPENRQLFLTRTMFHELSHNVENFYLTSVPVSTLDAIIEQYVKERNPRLMQRMAIYEAMKRLRPSENPKFFSQLLMKFNITEAAYKKYLASKTKVVPPQFRGTSIADDNADLRMDYYRSFTEWIAEKGAEWISKEAKGLVPKTAFQKFQKDILDLLRNVYKEIANALGYNPRPGAFEKFMEEIYGKRKSATSGTTYRVFDSRVIDYRDWGYSGQSQGTASAAPTEAFTTTASAAPSNVEQAQKKLAGAYTAPPKMGFKGFLQEIKDAYESGSYKNLGDKLTRAISDRFIDLRRLDERYAEHMKRLGMKVQAAYDDRYAIAANLSSYAGILARENVLGMLESTLKYGGVPIIKRFSKDPLDGVLMISRDKDQPGLTFLGDLARADKLDAFKYYAMAKRVLGRYADKKAPITQQEARDIVAHYGKDADVVSAYDKYQQFNRAMMDMAVNAGVISREVADEFTKHNDYYPFYREMDETGRYTGPLFTSGVLTRTKIQQALGGTEKLEADPIEVIMKNAQFWMHSASKNMASRKIFHMMEAIGEAREIKKGERLAPGEIEGVTRENGKEKYFAVQNPDIAAALETTGAHQLPNWTTVPGKFTQFYRELVTRSPDFILKNIIRDPLNAFVTSGVSFNPFAAMDNFRKALVDPNNEQLMALQNYGIIGGFRSIPGTEDATQLLNTNFKPTSNGVYVVPNGNVLTGILAKAWNALGSASEASDASTRMEIYKRVLEATGNEAEAAFRAQEVINFRKQGASSLVRYMSIMVPFINGRIQGLDVTARAFSKENLPNTLVKGGYLFAVSMALQALMGDDEEYKQLPDYIRYGSMPVPLKLLGLGDSGFIAIPKPFEIGYIFQTLPETIVQAAMGNTEDRAVQKAAWEQLKNTFGLALFPQIIAPVAELLVNRSSLTGLPIVTEAMKNLPAELQYSSATSDIVKNLAGSVGLSPVQVEALIKGYGGQIVTSVLGAVDGMYRAATGTGIDKDWTQYPTVSTFLKTQQNTNPKGVADVYRLSAEIQGLTTAVNTYVGQGMAQKAMELMKENEGLFTLKSSISGLRTQLNTLSRQERMVVNNPNISQETKEAQVEQIREARRQISRAMSMLIDKTGK